LGGKILELNQKKKKKKKINFKLNDKHNANQKTNYNVYMKIPYVKRLIPYHTIPTGLEPKTRWHVLKINKLK
jgi:hypothetical protein